MVLDGAQGPQGPKGETGPKGDKGEPGEKGDSAGESFYTSVRDLGAIGDGVADNTDLFETLEADKVYYVPYYIVMDATMVQEMVDIRITNYKNLSVSKKYLLSLFKYSNNDFNFQKSIIKILEEVGVEINKETNVVNNAQEIIEITKKAKEENIKKDIDTLESLILEAARDGKYALTYGLSNLKSDIPAREDSDNEIFKHFRNKGFKCSITEGSHLGRYIKIKWGD